MNTYVAIENSFSEKCLYLSDELICTGSFYEFKLSYYDENGTFKDIITSRFSSFFVTTESIILSVDSHEFNRLCLIFKSDEYSRFLQFLD